MEQLNRITRENLYFWGIELPYDVRSNPDVEFEMGKGFDELIDLRNEFNIKTYPERPLSNSSLKEFDKESTLDYIEYLREPRKGSLAFITGQYFEDMLCERNLDKWQHIKNADKVKKVHEEQVLKTKTNPAWIEYFTEMPKINSSEEAAKVLREGYVYDDEMHELVCKMVASAKRHEYYEKIKTGSYQIEITKFCEISNLKILVKLDVLQNNEVIDIKSVDSIADFKDNIFSGYQYWKQPALYALGTSCENFTFFVTEKKRPFYTHIYTFDKTQLSILIRKLYIKTLIPFSNCLIEGFFKSEVNIPKWF